MTAKEFVQERLPKAKAERQVRGSVKGFKSTYYLIRDGRNTLYIASGDTESKAWENTKEVLIEEENSKLL